MFRRHAHDLARGPHQRRETGGIDEAVGLPGCDPMTRETPAIVVIGATGYTGRLIARELAGGDRPFVVAARDPDRLERLTAELGGAVSAPVDVTSPASLRRLIQPGDAVINTAGPFTELGEPVIEACIDRGAHYLDTTGEQPFMRAMYERHHDAARRAGVAIVNAMAFEYALGDCGAAVVADGAGPLRSLDVVYAWGSGASSGGTRRTMVRMIGRKAWARRERTLERRPQGSRRRSVRLASGHRLSAVWFGSGEVVTAPRHLEVETARGWIVVGSAASRVVPLIAPLLPLAVPLLRPLLERIVARAPDPTPAERSASTFTIRVEATPLNGAPRALEVHGRDPYGVTAAIAVRGAQRAMDGAPAGVLPPAGLVEPRPFLESLADRHLRLVPEPAGD